MLASLGHSLASPPLTDCCFQAHHCPPPVLPGPPRWSQCCGVLQGGPSAVVSSKVVPVLRCPPRWSQCCGVLQGGPSAVVSSEVVPVLWCPPGWSQCCGVLQAGPSAVVPTAGAVMAETCTALSAFGASYKGWRGRRKGDHHPSS